MTNPSSIKLLYIHYIKEINAKVKGKRKSIKIGVRLGDGIVLEMSFVHIINDQKNKNSDFTSRRLHQNGCIKMYL